MFGSKLDQISPRVANLTLQVLQSRRLSGTLDLELPKEITTRVSPYHIESALQWLRRNYVVDEDAAIIARIEREDKLEEKKWIENRGGDLHGEGVFERVRTVKEAKAQHEEAEKKKREEEEAAGLVKQAEEGPKGIMAWTKTTLARARREDEALGR